MANNPYVNKVQYGNNTLIDLTADTVTADKILQGYTAHDRSGAGIVGTYVAPTTPTDITPSNTTPPALSIDVPVNPKGTGYAIASQPESKTPSDTSPASVASGSIVRPSAAGYLIAHSPLSVTPNDTNPVTVNKNVVVRATEKGYLYASPSMGNLQFPYVRPNYTEEIHTITHRPGRIFIIVNPYNGQNGTYLNNLHIYHSTDAGETWTEWTDWKSGQFTIIGKSSLGNYTAGYGAWFYPFLNGSGGKTFQAGDQIKLTCVSNQAMGLGFFY